MALVTLFVAIVVGDKKNATVSMLPTLSFAHPTLFAKVT